MSKSTLDYSTLSNAVSGSAAAFRLTLRLEAVSPKVFPPTYEGGKYATEERIIGGEKLPCVLLDSVASQANRMELALQEAVDDLSIKFPLTVTDFSTSKETASDQKLRRFKISSLQAPHRIADAILRDASLVIDGKKPVKFKDTEIGKALDDEIDFGNATALLKFAPHCLVFGLWHSTGEKRRAMGVKFSRAIISEIVGVNAIPGVTSASRLDPLGIQRLIDKEDDKGGVRIYKAKGGGWTLKKEEAEKDGDKPVLYGKKGKPSEILHGNVTPDIVYRRDKNGNLVLGDVERPVMMVVFDNNKEQGQKYVIRDERKPISKGGFTIEYAEQTTVLSLPALRRLRFPLKPGEPATDGANKAARTYLAALGLLSATLAFDNGYDLRSRCVLHASSSAEWQLLDKPGESKKYILDKEGALKLYADALAEAQNAKLPIHLEKIILTPSDDLVTLVKKSMEIGAADVGEGVSDV